jgi:hypothetical protein
MKGEERAEMVVRWMNSMTVGDKERLLSYNVSFE